MRREKKFEIESQRDIVAQGKSRGKEGMSIFRTGHRHELQKNEKA